MTAETTSSSAPASGLLFYRQAVPLQSDKHSTWRLLPGSLAFAAETNAIPAVVGEFAVAAQHFPILFAGKEAAPIVAVGLTRTNLFVREGKWAEDSYVPAYVRRYPFVFMQGEEGNSYVLALDAEAEHVNQGGSNEGEPLFAGGKATELVSNALRFCGDFTREHEATRQFSAGLVEHDLLIERRLDVSLNNGEKIGVNGFSVIDVEKFGKLPEEVVVAWHRNGWLALVHHHLGSLARFTALLKRHAEQDVPRSA